MSAITISRPNSQCIELTSLSDLDRRPDGAEQTDAGEPSEFYGSRHSNPMDRERQRTSGCSNDCTNATTFGKEKVAQKPSDAPSNNSENKNRISGTSSAGLSRTSRSSVSGASVTAAGEVKIIKQYISHYWYISYLTVCLIQDLHNSMDRLHNTHFLKKIEIVKVINTALKSILKLQSVVAKRCKV